MKTLRTDSGVLQQSVSGNVDQHKWYALLTSWVDLAERTAGQWSNGIGDWPCPWQWGRCPSLSWCWSWPGNHHDLSIQTAPQTRSVPHLGKPTWTQITENNLKGEGENNVTRRKRKKGTHCFLLVYIWKRKPKQCQEEKRGEKDNINNIIIAFKGAIPD